VVILTTSKAEEDILKTYNLHATANITKPVDLEQFVTVVNYNRGFLAGDRQTPKKRKNHECSTSQSPAGGRQSKRRPANYGNHWPRLTDDHFDLETLDTLAAGLQRPQLRRY